MTCLMKRLFFVVAVGSVMLLSAKPPAFKVASKVSQKGVVYMAVNKNDELMALLDTGEVKAYSTDGKELWSFKAEVNGNVRTIAVDGDDIYILATTFELKEKVVKGKKYKVSVPVSSECHVFDKTGAKGTTIPIPDVQSVNAALISGKRLVVADYAKKTLFFLNLPSGKLYKKVDQGFRLCCGIFDICRGPKDSVMVANLGAFEVQTYKAGRKSRGFGKRGNDLEDFHGCCNPVSLACLSKGYVVTVEKDPTRVKIFDKSNRKAGQIEGLEELVQGCAHIPIVVDSKDNVYLAAGKKGYIVKCVSK